MFFQILNFARKTAAKQPERPLSENRGADEDCRFKSTQQQTEELQPKERAREHALSNTEVTGKDSLRKLKAVAREQQREQMQAKGHWFNESPKESSAPADVRATANSLHATSNSTACPQIPEAERMKAIEELLSMGFEHFTINRSAMDDTDRK